MNGEQPTLEVLREEIPKIKSMREQLAELGTSPKTVYRIDQWIFRLERLESKMEK